MTEKEVPLIFQKNRLRQTDAEILSDKAAKALADLTEVYLIQVKKDIQTMYDILKQAETAAPQKKNTLIQGDFFTKMHDLKGQGATFGYPLLTDIGRVACDFMRHKKGFSGLDIDLLKEYVNDAHHIIEENLTGSGGAWGQALQKRLNEEKDA